MSYAKPFFCFFFSLMILTSCEGEKKPLILKVEASGECAREKAFIEGLAELAPGGGERVLPVLAGEEDALPDIILELYGEWEEPDKAEPLLARTWFVPQGDSLEPPRDAALADCLAGKERLVPLGELTPPAVALRVEGLTVEDDNYPLAFTVRGRIRTQAPGENIPRKQAETRQKRLEEAASALGELLADKTIPFIEPKPDLFWIASGGDLMLDRGAAEILLKEGPRGIFGGTAALLESADLALVNLEGVVSLRGEKVKKSFNFRFNPNILPALKDAGIDGVLHANNHVFDYGMTAFLDSIQGVRAAGLGLLGAGENEEAAAAPFVFSKDGVQVNCYGIASFPRERNGWDGLSAAAGPALAGMLHAGRGGADKLAGHFSDGFDLVLFHGGAEWSRRPDKVTRALYTDLVKRGADLIIGSHPHVTQGFEWIDGKAVFWSLGNYVFGGMENTDGGEEGLFLCLGYLGTHLVYLEPYPLILTYTRTDIAPREKLSTFYRLSRDMLINSEFNH